MAKLKDKARRARRARKAAMQDHDNTAASVAPQEQSDATQVQYYCDIRPDKRSYSWSTEFSFRALLGSLHIGSIFARLICKNNIREQFWQAMSNTSTTCYMLSQYLFDRYGCLKEEFINGNKRGSGVWAREMNEKCMVVIEIAAVKLGWENSEIMEQLFTRLFDHTLAHDKTVFIIVAPASIMVSAHGEDTEGIPTPEAPGTYQTISDPEQFLRMQAYRRVGASPWFAKAFAAEHPSRSLDAASDFNCHTKPMDEVARVMQVVEAKRTQANTGQAYTDVSIDFRGYDDETTNMLLALQEAPRPISSEHMARVKFGCTCGECTLGYVSPRMLFTLQKQSQKVYMIVRETMMSDHVFMEHVLNPRKQKRHVVGLLWPACCRIMRLTMMESKDVRIGYAYIFHYIARILQSRALPVLSKVCQDIQDPNLDFEDDPCPCCDKLNGPSPQTLIRLFLLYGGTAESCLKGLFNLCMNKDEKAGDDTFHWRQPHIPGWDFATQYKALPRCRNDSEFGFVLGMLLEH